MHQDWTDPVSLALFREISNDARDATRVEWVQFTLYDTERGVVNQVALSPFKSLRGDRAVRMARRIIPRFLPELVIIDPMGNDSLKAIYTLGKPIHVPLEAVCEGQVPRVLVHLAKAVAKMRWVFVHPLIINGAVWGALNFHAPQPLTAEQQKIAYAFSRQAVLTLENAVLNRELGEQVETLKQTRQRLIVTEERLRRQVAEQLHGRLQTELFLMEKQLNDAAQELAADDPIRTVVEAVAQEARRIREDEVRPLSHTLYAGIIAVGLVPALRTLARHWSRVCQVDLDVDDQITVWDGVLEHRLDDVVRLGLYRVASEAVNNAVRHGGALRIMIRLRPDGDGIGLTVEDDGRGFRVQGARYGLGLYSIHDRVAELGGTWEIASTPGQGTRVACRVPLTAAPEWSPPKTTAPPEPADYTGDLGETAPTTDTGH